MLNNLLPKSVCFCPCSRSKPYALSLVTLLFSLKSMALSLPGIFSDGMVLQRHVKDPVWGWTSAGARVEVFFKGKRYTATADKGNGKWQVLLAPAEAGGPYDLSVRVKDSTLVVRRVLIGDVWLCSGQSNMVLDFNYPRLKALYGSEIASSACDNIRQILINRTYASMPMADCKTSGWVSASPGSLGNFSAVAYFFALNLYKKFHVPIGIVNASYGGSMAESWTSEEFLYDRSKLQKKLDLLHDTAAISLKVAGDKRRVSDWDANVKKPDAGLTEAQPWTGPELDETNWKTMPKADFWDSYGFADRSGVFWFRKEIFIPDGVTGSHCSLILGQVDDADVTYINGQKVGASGNRDVKRVYDVPVPLLHPGKNVIAIRVTNYNGTGGLFPSDTSALKFGDKRISLTGPWLFRPSLELPSRPGIFDPATLPAALFNAMIAPLIPYSMKAVLWYQGENNSHFAHAYQQIFPNMVRDWRAHWQNNELPFVFEQLPNYQAVQALPGESEWAELREAQLMSSFLPQTAMAVAIDLGEVNAIHPVRKKEVGSRLALAAQNLVYGAHIPGAYSPRYTSMLKKKNTIIISFDTGGSRLVAKDGLALKYFAVAGADKKFVWANAVIRGNTVEVSSPEIAAPVAVRYAWAGNPQECNLFNDLGLPASPFRTDDWPGLTTNNQ